MAVEQGRVIFNSIRKFIVFLLSGNVGAILVVGMAMLFGTTYPLLPLQILYLNMISDVFPALALGEGRGELLLAVYFQPLAGVLSMVAPTSGEWAFILGMSLIPLGVVQVLKQFAFLNPYRKKA